MPSRISTEPCDVRSVTIIVPKKHSQIFWHRHRIGKWYEIDFDPRLSLLGALGVIRFRIAHLSSFLIWLRRDCTVTATCSTAQQRAKVVGTSSAAPGSDFVFDSTTSEASSWMVGRTMTSPGSPGTIARREAHAGASVAAASRPAQPHQGQGSRMTRHRTAPRSTASARHQPRPSSPPPRCAAEHLVTSKCPASGSWHDWQEQPRPQARGAAHGHALEPPIWSRPQHLMAAIVGAQSWWLWIRDEHLPRCGGRERRTREAVRPGSAAVARRTRYHLGRP
jgi:hypothetical protein